MLSYSSGDAGAFETLYQRHKAPLYRFILRQTSQSVTDELFQDVWLKLINSRSRYKATAGFKTWLYHIARNRIIDYYRRQSIRPADHQTVEAGSIPANPGTGPDSEFEADAMQQKLLLAISALPREQKEAFLLREEAGLSIDEIAHTCGTNIETAKSRLRYAVDKLRKQLDIPATGDSA